MVAPCVPESGPPEIVDLLAAALDRAYQAVGMSTAIHAEVRRKLESARASGELERVQRELERHLLTLQAEYDQRRHDKDRLAANLRDRLTIVEQAAHYHNTESNPAPRMPGDNSEPQAPPALDPCTGLPTRSEAELAIQRAAAREHPVYIGVFCLQRMAATNARFGEAIGDQMMLFCGRHLATHLTQINDALFRWSGPAFVALLERNDSLPVVASEVQRLLSAPLRRFFELPSRTIYLPIKLAGIVLTSGSEAVKQIESYVARVSEPG